MGDDATAIKYFIKEAPVGELPLVLKDIEQLRGNKDFLENPEILETLRTYYETHISHHQLSNGIFVAVTKEGRLPSDDAENYEQLRYVDFARGIIFSLNVKDGSASLVQENYTLGNEQVEHLKNELAAELKEYISQDYKEDSTLAAIFVDGTEDLTFRINISCHNLNLSNYWGGEWISTFDVSHSLGSNEFSLLGRIKINNHYFESGNIQFNMVKNFEEEVQGQGIIGQIGKSIVQTIKRLEEEY